MKFRALLVSITAMVIAFALGCDAGQPASGTLHLNLASPHFATSRGFVPSIDEMTIAGYRVSGVGPKNQTFEVSAENASVTIGNLAIGWWTIHAVGVNTDEVELVSGDLTTLLSSKTATAKLELSNLVGEGTLEAKVCWDPDQVADDVSVVATLTNQSGAKMTIDTGTIDTAKGEVLISASLPAGSYLLSLQLYSQGVQVSGAIQALRILDKQESAGEIEMIIGDLSTTYVITIIDNTMLPIDGTITINPTEPLPGKSVTFSWSASELPEGIDVSDLAIRWYCEGILLVDEDEASLTCTPKPGTHRYDIVVSHSRLGSLGSSTILVSMPVGAGES